MNATHARFLEKFDTKRHEFQWILDDLQRIRGLSPRDFCRVCPILALLGDTPQMRAQEGLVSGATFALVGFSDCYAEMRDVLEAADNVQDAARWEIAELRTALLTMLAL